MSTDQDLFSEEKTMVSMSFGDHLEELRTRLILALLGLMVGVAITFLPPLNLGARVMTKMQAPAQGALDKFYRERAIERTKKAEIAKVMSPPVEAAVSADSFVDQLRTIAPNLDLPPAESLKGKTFTLKMTYPDAQLIPLVARTVEPHNALISLAPLESITIFFMVCLVAGLVVSSPWVFYQIWAFVGAGLYRHERNYVTKLLPFSLGLFLAGVFLCFFGVLPITLGFLLEFNVWLGIEPTLRLSDWMSFATMLPLVFGISFQTPLVMMFLAKIGVFTAADYREKRKYAILIMVVLAAVLTPGPDVFSQLMLAVPMIMLYELGILLVGAPKNPEVAVG